ncbi:hypothetical protein [Mycobacterium sp. P7213]|uniref:hypothetical protein n=1 Tax=Mycobacterium sp. P7213 TaxID=2478465 RepID=UPI001F14FE59|nr:hypothetical protein [Mycobacterium sp. P7213]
MSDPEHNVVRRPGTQQVLVDFSEVLPFARAAGERFGVCGRGPRDAETAYRE